ncbi:MAG: hypothetical protein ACJ790_04745 [Myxococcaceae bacterium]
MKRFLVAALVFAGGAAFAHDNAVDQTNVKHPEHSLNDVDRNAPDATDVTSYTAKQWQLFKKQADIGTQNRKDTKELANAHHYMLRGTIADAGGSHVKVKRNGLPDASFDIRKESKVFLDGREVAAKYLPKGTDVVVKFNLDGNDAIALSVLANTDKGFGGSGDAKADTKADAKKADAKADAAEDKAEMKDTKATSKTTKTKKNVTGHTGSKKGADKDDIPTKNE